MEIFLNGHEHLINLFRGEIDCDACDNPSYSCGISCNTCDFTVHFSCRFVFSIPETYEHLSHVGHCLKLLTIGRPPDTYPKCHICGKQTKRLLYHCFTCKLNMDIDCMLNDMSARASINMPWHHHSLVKIDSDHEMECDVCGRSDGECYFCPSCKLMVHEKCVSDSPEINHPFHLKHSLKLLTDGAPDYTDGKCHVCGQHIKSVVYHCVICKFNLDISCANEDPDQHNLPPVVLKNLKVREHTFTLVPRLISFICDACGMKGDRSPYFSIQGGDHMYFHQDCVHLPRVIHVNRHDHRVSYKYPLGLGKGKCDICWEDIDWSYGAYSCSLCPNYVLHSRCATRKDVWDGKELDGVPEEVLDSEPFKLNADNTITHFAHEHNMSLNKEGIPLVESILCKACVCPIASSTFYYCSVCNFILHEACANLPKLRRHFLSPKPLRLFICAAIMCTKCNACGQIICEGFLYVAGDECFDLVCCSITVPFIHGSHDHPLLYPGRNYGNQSCHNCGKLEQVLGCIKCNYYLEFRCATLPLTVSVHNYDDHPLTLCYGEEANDKYWCEICEREINPKKWFYTCNDCCATLHIFCVLGDMFRYAKPGAKIGEGFEMVFNHASWRPNCNKCHCRCVAPFYLIWELKKFCSLRCYFSHVFAIPVFVPLNVSPPPWIEELDS